VAILISQRVHPEAIKRFLGHTSIMVTVDIYGHPFPSDQEALANARDDAFAQSQTDNDGQGIQPATRATCERAKQCLTFLRWVPRESNPQPSG
jgi:hypothetical protein